MPSRPGEDLHRFAALHYPICRSITGAGLRKTLDLIGERIPLVRQEVRSGSQVFDWEVPAEWNIEGASLLDPRGRCVADFEQHNLHIVHYSEPVQTTIQLEELAPRLHSLTNHPAWIPYRTTYYRRSWGFCLADEEKQALRPGDYRAEIKSSLGPGSLSYGEAVVPGKRSDEVVFFTHVCHPSLANDNTSGIAVLTALAEWVASASRRYTYRFVFAPGTIGTLCWLQANEDNLGRIKAGLVLALLGDPAPLTYKMSRASDTETDAVAARVLAELDPEAAVIPFTPYGYDERQLCSPGFNLPIGRLTRSVEAGYPEYHSSADDLSLIRPQQLEQSLEACKRFVHLMEENRRYINLNPKGEPFLGKHGLYRQSGGGSPSEREHAILWVLSQSDGSKSLLDIANRAGLSFDSIQDVADALERAKLLVSDDQATDASGSKGKA